MKAGATPYWACGGEVLTRALDRDGRLTVRPVPPAEATALAAFYADRPEGAALTAARRRTAAWVRAAGALY